VAKSTHKLILAMLVVVALAAAFWILLLSPKRQEASDLAKQVETAEGSLAQHRAEVANAVAARKEFPVNYGQLVVLGKAVPRDSETASLLVQVQHISEHAGVRFEEISLASEGGEAAAAPAAEGTEVAAGAAAPAAVSPTEVAASTMPLGASVGPAGLAAMPYTLTFTGDFFHIADFIHGLDSLVKTTNSNVSVDGRLITVNAFSLAGSSNGGFPQLQATFSVTTYLTPPEQGITGGATPAGPVLATPTATTTGGTP
jgi:Tfp pilus assembly protein PilO